MKSITKYMSVKVTPDTSSINPQQSDVLKKITGRTVGNNNIERKVKTQPI